jgi:hypothetical protein
MKNLKLNLDEQENSMSKLRCKSLRAHINTSKKQGHWLRVWDRL